MRVLADFSDLQISQKPAMISELRTPNSTCDFVKKLLQLLKYCNITSPHPSSQSSMRRAKNAQKHVRSAIQVNKSIRVRTFTILRCNRILFTHNGRQHPSFLGNVPVVTILPPSILPFRHATRVLLVKKFAHIDHMHISFDAVHESRWLLGSHLQ